LGLHWVALFGLLGLLPFLGLVRQVYLYGGELPWQDQWWTPGHLFDE